LSKLVEVEARMTKTQQRELDDWLQYLREERAAICEYDGGMTREAAEALADREVAKLKEEQGV
jgi:hypothetical protein